jgi:hypothetical protein
MPQRLNKEYIPDVTVHWLIEVDVFADTASRISSVLDARAQPWTRYHDDVRSAELPSRELPVIFWGSLGAAYAQHVAAQWKPGVVGDVGRFNCSAYYPRLGGINVANRDAVFTTVAELVAAPVATVAPLGSPERVFVRPDSPLKPFSGRELAVADINLAALDHGFYYVSAPKAVGREWRFVVADSEVIAGCEYIASREGVGVSVPDAARALAEQVAAAEWQAAPLYVVDVAEVDDEFGVMELNPFSGADLYHCDPESVVDAASQVAERLFAEQAQ